MNKISAFSFDSMTDKDLRKMMEVINYELAIREERKRKFRYAWIEEALGAYLRHPNASCKIIGDLTIVAVYERYKGITFGVTRPINGDVYDESTGIAVAFAKAMGDVIPDYI
jgi:hypothetical protein